MLVPKSQMGFIIRKTYFLLEYCLSVRLKKKSDSQYRQHGIKLSSTKKTKEAKEEVSL